MSSEVRWLAERRVDGVLHGRVGRSRDDLAAEWIGVARLFARRDGSHVRLVPEPGASPEDVEKIRRGSAALLLRHLEGKVSLHGAAVALEGRAIVLLGGAEAGKSTLAAGLCLQRGAQLLADDAVALEHTTSGVDVVGLERDHWLDAPARRALQVETPDARAKRPVRATSPPASRAPLAALVDVAFVSEGAPRLSPLSGVEAFACILAQVVRFVVDEPELQRLELDAISELLAAVPVWRLARPRDLDLLGETSALIADLARAR